MENEYVPRLITKRGAELIMRSGLTAEELGKALYREAQEIVSESEARYGQELDAFVTGVRRRAAREK